MAKEKKKEELYFVIGMIVLFGGVLIGVDIWYSDWAGMADTPLYTGIIGVITLHLATAAAAYVSLIEWRDYAFDIVRKWFCGFVFVSILYVGGFRAAKNERKGVSDDSIHAKKEQNDVLYQSISISVL